MDVGWACGIEGNEGPVGILNFFMFSRLIY